MGRNNRQKVTSEWIPVSERLPEYDEFVLVTANGKHNNITFEHAIELAVYAKDKVCAEDKGWILEAYPDWLEPNVTAWQPLPEPYKEQTMIFDVELNCDKWKDCKTKWCNGDGGFWCKEDCKLLQVNSPSNRKKVEKIFSNGDAVYILYADGTWMKKEKK